MDRSTVEIRLGRQDWWRRHGLLNVSVAITGLLLVLFSPVLLIIGNFRFDSWGPSIGALFVGVLIVVFEQAAIHSMVARFARAPYLSLSDEGIRIDGGPLDRWSFPWSEIASLAPTIDRLCGSLAQGEFTYLQFQVANKPRWRPFSAIQHLKFRDIFEVSGYFDPLSQAEVECIARYARDNVTDIQSFLISDWPE